MSSGRISPPLRANGVIVVWVIAAVLSVLIGFFVAENWRLSLVSVALGFIVVFSFFVHMNGGSSAGFISRVAWSVTGSFVIFTVATAVFAVLKVIGG